MFSALRTYFDRQGWRYEILEGAHVLRSHFHADAGDWVTFAHVRDEPRQVVVYSVADERCPADRRSAMAELVTRANFGLVLGNLELDFSDGEVRAKTSLGLGGSHLDDQSLAELVEGLVEANLRVFHRYMPGVVAVIAGASPAAQVAAIDG
ncbi:MAG TPA: YbjN domain-containing protein [Acidimicrobiales bacterium]|nr:YbjN domain-containing protein [Acidimicrobiales bacterium]